MNDPNLSPDIIPMQKLTNREYTKLVDEGKFPEDPMVPIDEPFINGNGLIKNLLLEKFTSVAVITSRPGCTRANHYHKTDWHYAYILSGTVLYFWRPVGDRGLPKMQQYMAGQLFFTPQMVEHSMCFPVDTTIITFAKNIRDHENHEADLVRIPLIKAEWVPNLSFFDFNVNPEVVDPQVWEKHLQQLQSMDKGPALLSDEELAEMVRG